MLALAPPIQHTTSDCSLPRPSSSTAAATASSSSSRSSRPSSHKSHSNSYSVPLQPSSSSAALSSSSTSRAPTSGDSSSPHRAVPHRTPSAEPTQTSHSQLEDNSEELLPPSEANGHQSGAAAESAPLNVDIHQVDAQTLLHLLATALDQIAHLNDGRPHAGPHMLSNGQGRPNYAPSPDSPLWRTLTSASRYALQTSSSLTFHARNIPTIPLEAYLLRIHKYCPASNEVFVSLLVYFDRMNRLAKEACGRIFAVDSYNIHRLVIAGVTVASKFFSDVFYTNSRYAKVGGLPMSELNQLELQFLYLNDFGLRISNEELQYYANALVKQTQIPSDVSIAPYLPQSPALLDPNERPPIGPRSYFAAVDSLLAHGNANAEGNMLSPRSRTPSPVHPIDEYRRSASSYSVSSTSDAASEAGTETDVDGSTDDEPTIRAPHSSSSETTSVHSVASDADSIYTDDGDRNRDSYEGSGRDYRMMSP